MFGVFLLYCCDLIWTRMLLACHFELSREILFVVASNYFSIEFTSSVDKSLEVISVCKYLLLGCPPLA